MAPARRRHRGAEADPDTQPALAGRLLCGLLPLARRHRATAAHDGEHRSEERRVGKECRSRWWGEYKKKKKEEKTNQLRRRKSMVSATSAQAIDGQLILCIQRSDH